MKESIRAAKSYPFLVILVTASPGRQAAMKKLDAALFSQSNVHQCIWFTASYQAAIFQKKHFVIRKAMLN